MAFSKKQISNLYHRRAAHYDMTANMYYLLGFREQAYRKKAVSSLQLAPGDTVVELGCGTGLNFSLLQQAISGEGKIIGVDLTEQMLDQARIRIDKQGWRNVELVHIDAALYSFPAGVDGVLSTFALTLAPEYDLIIQHAADALAPGKRCVVLDLKKPEHMPMWLVRFGVYIAHPFGVSMDLTERHPWESIERYLEQETFEDLYFGFAYISTGKSRAASK